MLRGRQGSSTGLLAFPLPQCGQVDAVGLEIAVVAATEVESFELVVVAVALCPKQA